MIMYSKPVIDQELPRLKKRVKELKNSGLIPSLHVIQVGDHPASSIYINKKKEFCELVGADFKLIHLEESVSEKEFLKAIHDINDDKECTGCFVQLPVPKHLKHIDTTTLIHPAKDVDGFGPHAIVSLYKDQDDENKNLIPCTPKGVISLLKFYQIELSGKNVVMIGRSFIVGRPLFHLLNKYDATVTLCHSKTKDLRTFTKNADIIISATGNAKFIDESYIRKDKSQILIDIGIVHDQDNKVCGDMDFENLKDHVKAITPVPKGIGPMTVYSLIENLIEATENRLEQRSI